MGHKMKDEKMKMFAILNHPKDALDGAWSSPIFLYLARPNLIDRSLSIVSEKTM